MRFDAIVVLSCGSQTNEDVNTLPEYVKLRLDKCWEIYKDNLSLKIIVTSAGTPHRKNYVNPYGYSIYECDSMAKYLVEKYNIPPENIFREFMSYDTIGNAFFTKLNYIKPLNIKNFYLITSDFHMQRSKFIFEFIYNKVDNENQYNIKYVSTNNSNVSKQALEKRLEKEKESIIFFKSNINNFRLKNFDNLFKWIYRHHNAYSTKGLLNRKYTNNDNVTLY